MAINKVWRVRNHRNNTIQYFEKYPHVRKYFLQNSQDYAMIVVEELQWIYKKNLVDLLNESVDIGRTLELIDV